MTQPTPDREREALLEWLDGQRSHVLGVLKGLSDDNLRQPVLPSGWSCLAMVRHLAVDRARRTRGSRAAERAAPGTAEHERKAAAWRTGKGRSAR